MPPLGSGKFLWDKYCLVYLLEERSAFHNMAVEEITVPVLNMIANETLVYRYFPLIWIYC
jgi:hypothetical protein